MGKTYKDMTKSMRGRKTEQDREPKMPKRKSFDMDDMSDDCRIHLGGDD